MFHLGGGHSGYYTLPFPGVNVFVASPNATHTHIHTPPLNLPVWFPTPKNEKKKTTKNNLQAADGVAAA